MKETPENLYKDQKQIATMSSTGYLSEGVATAALETLRRFAGLFS